MKTIILLTGGRNAGKSLTIRKVYQQLLGIYLHAQRVNVNVQGRIGPKETYAIVTIDVIKIGIESFGDYPKRLRESLRKFRDVGCDLIICAAHPEFAHDVVDEVPDYVPAWIDKLSAGSVPADREKANEKTAKRIVAKVVKLLRKKRRR
jgi:hypothetical protein